MKYYRLICCFIIFALSSKGESRDILDLIAQIDGVKDHRVENYPPGIEEYREEVSKYYSERVTSEKSNPPPQWAAILLTLDHPIGIETVLHEYYKNFEQEGNSLYDNQFALGSNAKESVLPYIYENVHHGINLYGFRRDANLLVLHIIMNSCHFPEKSRQWAKELCEKMTTGPVLPYTDSILAQINDWLYYNRDAILDERYKEATWLPDGPLKESPNGKETRKPNMALLPPPVLTKLVKTLPAAGEERASKARLIGVLEFFPERARETKRNVPGPAAFTPTVSSQRFSKLMCLSVSHSLDSRSHLALGFQRKSGLMAGDGLTMRNQDLMITRT